MLHNLFLLALLFLGARAADPERVMYTVHYAQRSASHLRQQIEDTELRVEREIGVPGWYVVSAPSSTHEHVRALQQEVDAMHELKPLHRKTRDDPSMRDAWYLTGESRYGAAIPTFINASAAWQRRTGRGVGLAIVDDGLATQHRDLKPNYKAKQSLSLCGGDVDPPTSRFTHGTMAAAVAAGALDNGVCGAGVAPNANLAGLRLLSCRMTDADEATALSYHCDARVKDGRNDIFSNSWGPYDDGKHIEGPGPATKAAIEHCIASGREGKGSIYVWAAGNGGRNRDCANWDGYANSRYTIAVGAITDAGLAPWYGEWGAPILVSVGSNGGQRIPGSGIATSTYDPYNDAACGWFGGTSAAAPQAAGVVALMLEARPDLTWRDVQHILVQASSPIDVTNNVHPWVTNAAGVTSSTQYGAGMLSASRAVDIAESWQLVGAEKRHCSLPLDGHHAPIQPGSGPQRFELALHSDIHALETVELHVNIQCDGSVSDIGRLRLRSPSGTTVLLSGDNRESSSSLDWTLTAMRFWGEAAGGSWEILTENTGRAPFYIDSVRLCAYGQ